MKKALVSDIAIIRPLSPDDALDELTELLHRAYAPLAAAGMRFLASHQNVATTLFRATSGSCFVCETENKLVGTITIYSSQADSPCEYYRQGGVFHFGQFAVDPDIQAQGLGDMLLRHAEEFATKMGAHTIAFDTPENADRLISWYVKRGYKPVGKVDWDATNYASIVFGKDLSVNGPSLYVE